MGVPALEERFTEPPGWRWHSFKIKGRMVRFGTASPQGSVPDAIVVCLPGLGEFGEKYFETARDCLSKNLAFWVFDWMGQGRSERYMKNSQKRHSRGYDRDVDDLHTLIIDYIKHSAVHPDVGRIPLVMLAHSMGGNAGMHYLIKYPGIFECAAFSAPLFGLKALSGLPARMGLSVAGAVSFFADTAYVAGFGDWRAEIRSAPAINYYSSDETRAAVHNGWCLAEPALQVGGVTYGWIYETQKSCMALWKKGAMDSVQTHCLLALAGKETFVSNAAIRKAAATLPYARLIELPDSLHEILMERDAIRKVFLDGFFDLVKERVINRPETLKPF